MTDETWTDEDAELWLPIVAPNGQWDLDQVKRELHDYSMLLGEVPLVYDHVTNGRVSKPNTLASAVIDQHDDHCTNGVPENECPDCGLDHPWACGECGKTLDL